MRIWLAVVGVLLAGCADPAGVREMGKGTPPAALVPMPPEMLPKCRRHPEVRDACPTRVPRVERAAYVAAQPFAHDDLWGFTAQWNAPFEGLDPRNAPPRFAHLNVRVGDLRPVTGFDIHPSRGRSPHEVRDYGVGFGPRTWNGRRGELYLAPSHNMGGGSDADHLVFRWTSGGRTYAVSLHAWDRLDETEATLKAVMESLP
jgi:hypothetical protein